MAPPLPAQGRVVLRGVTHALLLVDSITEAVHCGRGAVVVSGSHGGVSAGRFARQARVHLAIFNDAGGGKEDAGVAALALLHTHGIAACTVAHTSARIGEARSTLEDGVISHANPAAKAMGASVGVRLAAWLRPDGLTAAATESSPARR
jgi:hypothetical protein